MPVPVHPSKLYVLPPTTIDELDTDMSTGTSSRSPSRLRPQGWSSWWARYALSYLTP